MLDFIQITGRRGLALDVARRIRGIVSKLSCPITIGISAIKTVLEIEALCRVVCVFNLKVCEAGTATATPVADCYKQ